MGQRGPKNIFQFLSVLLLATLFGCSSSLFTGDTKNDEVVGDGNFNKSCLGLDLSKETLSVRAARGLMACLNSNGSIQEFADLLNGIDDAELESLLGVVNREILTNPDRLKEITVTFDQMDSRGTFDRAMTATARVLENPDFLTAVLAAVQKGGRVATDDGASVLDPEILTAISIAAKEFEAGNGSTANTARALEIGVSTVSLPSYKELVLGLRPEIEAPNNLKHLASLFHAYAQAKIDTDEPKLLQVLLEGIADKTIFRGLDHFYYEECEGAAAGMCGDRPRLSLDHQVSSMASFVSFLTRERRDVLERLTQLFGKMNRPIRCMGTTKEIPNADLYMMDRMVSQDPLAVPSWVVRNNSVKLKLASGMCDYPESFDELMAVLSELADPELVGRPRNSAAYDERVLVTIAHFLQGLKVGDEHISSQMLRAGIDRHRFRKFLIHWLGDTSAVSAYSHLTDVLSEFSRSDRNVIANLLYFLNSPDEVDRETLSHTTKVLLKPREELNGKSLYDVVVGVIRRVDIATAYDVIKTLPAFVDSNEEILASLAAVNREAFFLNDAHPFVTVGLKVGRNADGAYRDTFNTAFLLAGRMPEKMRMAFSLAAKMAKNGSLKELIKGLLLPFRQTANQSNMNPRLQDIPPLRVSTNPDSGKSASKAPAWNPAAPYWPWEHADISACHEMSIEKALSPPSLGNQDPWIREMKLYARCIDADRKASEQSQAIVDFMDYGLEKKIGQQTFIGYLVDLAAGFVRTSLNLSKVYDELSDLLLRNDTFNDLVRFHESMTYTLVNKYGPHDLSVVQSLLRVFPLLSQAGNGGQERLQPLLNIAGKVVESPHAPKSAVLIYDLLDEADSKPAPTLAPKVPPRSFPVDASNSQVVTRAIELLNAVEKPKNDVERDKRLQEMFDEYLNYVRSDIRKREYRTSDEFKNSIKPLLDEVAKGTRLEWIVAFMHYLENDPYDPQWWESWFQRLSSRVFPIAYMYPGEKQRVRLVNYLDLLELIVNDANFTLKEVGQTHLSWLDGWILRENDVSAIRHLSKLGGYSANEDMTRWVDELHREIEVFDSIPALPGFDLLKPEVRRRLFNLKQVSFVVKHLNQKEDVVTAPDGTKKTRNDLGVLRDLFKMLNASMPVDQRRDYDRNHALSVVVELTEFGLLRMIGRNIWIHDEAGKKIPVSIANILRTLRDAAVLVTPQGRDSNKDTLALLDHLLRKDIKAGADPRTASFNDRYVFIGKFIDQYFEWVKNDRCDLASNHASYRCAAAAIKSSLYDFVNFASDSNNPQHLAKVLRTALSSKYTPFLGNHLEILEDVIATPKAAGFFGGLSFSKNDKRVINGIKRSQAYGDLVQVAKLSVGELAASNVTDNALSLAKDLKEDPLKRWDKAKATLDAMEDDPDYARYRDDVLKPIIKSVVYWLPRETALRERTQTYLGSLLRGGKVRELVRFGAQECVDDRFYQKIKFIGERDYVDGYQDFLEDLRAGLQDIH